MTDDATLPEVFRGIQRLEGGVLGMDHRIQGIESQVHDIGMDVVALKTEMRAHISAQTERTRARDVRCTDHAGSLGDFDLRLRQMESTSATTTTTISERWRIPGWVAYVGVGIPSVALLWDAFGKKS
jgi:hypothetical protein